MQSYDVAAQTDVPGFLTDGGEAGVLMRAHDWSAAPLGAPDGWPQPLKTLVGVMLTSSQPMFIAWGPERTLLYNDAYAEILAGKHPKALGGDILDVWHEIRADLVPIVEAAYAGRPVQMDDIELVMERKGYPEETHFAFSYTPVRNEAGAVAGFFCPCHEITGQVLAARRQAFRLALEERLRDIDEPEAVMTAAATLLGEHLGAERVGYGQVQPDDATVRLAHCYADGVQPLLGDFPLDGFGPASIARQRQGETEVCSDIFADPMRDVAIWRAIDARAFISVPLVREGRFRASLYVNSRDPRYWSAEDVALVEEVAARTWDAVERARAEARQQESEARFRDMADHAPVMMWVTDPSGRCTHLNRRWYTFTGQEPNSGEGYGWLDAVHPDDRSLAERAFLSANAEQRDYRVDFRLRRADGVYRWTIDAAAARFGPTGEYLGYVGSVIDIDERREAETRLALSEEQLRLATEAAEVGLWDVDVAHDILFWPARVKAMFGISPDKPATMADFYDGLHPEDRDESLRAYQAARDPERRALYDVEYRTIGKEDGVIRWVAAKGRGLFTDGACIRVIGTAIDITARKADEVQLRDLNERLEQKVAEQTAERNRVWEMSRDLFAIMGFDGYLKSINPAWEITLGRDAETLLSLPFQEQVHPDDYAAGQAMMERLLRGETVERFEDRLRHADASWRWISWTLVPEGDVFYAVGRDITSEKEAAAELERAQEALRQSQKMEAMGQLTGGVAHDFNNLLTPIVGSLDMLQRKGIGGEREQRLIAGALQSADRAKTLVQRLLAFARRQPLQASAVDIARLVTGMADLVASTSGPQIRVVVEAAENLPPAKADPNQLEMALLNLGVNARDAMTDGGTLRITASSERIRAGHRSKLGPGEYIRLSVADTGVGMDEATLARAVEPFFSTKGVGKGTGLGLSMVHGLASQLGGALTIESWPGVGTNVELWLPLSAAPAQVAEQPAAAVPTPAGRGKALLVDDEEVVRMSTADMLSDMGYAVVEAGSAEEALKLLNSGLRPDLLVTDHLMPGMNGTDLARLVRSDRPDIGILIVSGYADTDGIDADLPRLTKPFRNADLAAKLSEIAGAA